MKTFILGSILVILVGASTLLLAHNMDALKQKNIQVVSLTDLDEALLADFFKGNTSHIILECTEGTELPFQLAVKGEYLDLTIDHVPWNIKVLKTCFIKAIGNTFYFSTDLQQWQEFNDFFTGMIGVEMHVFNGTPKVRFNLELNSKH